MITIIASTNRKGSKTIQLAYLYQELCAALGVSANVLSLESFDAHNRNETFLQIEADILIPTKAFLFIVPEYNGSFPGILKMLIDNSDIKKCWWFKKSLLVGLADGRAGNLRGMDHLAGVLQYLKMYVHYDKLPISRINTIVNSHGEWISEDTKAACIQQLKGFFEISK